MRVVFRCAALLFIVMMAVRWTPVAADSTAEHVPAVVILNSYHQGYEWSDREIEGLLEGLQAVHPGMSPMIEHLDLKRFSGEDFENRLRGFLAGKYRNQKVNLAVVVDNPALDLILSHRDEILPGVPVVFVGINDFTPAMLQGESKITGVAEVQDHAGTLALAFALHPGCRRVLAVHDYTASGLAVRREMESLLPAYRDRVQISFNASATYEEMAAQIAGLPPDSLVLILSFATDSAGKSLTPEQSTAVLTAHARVPVYAMHETRLGHGIVGGMLIGGAEHGRRAAALALRVLAGEEPASIPVETHGTARPMFDYLQLKRFDIPLEALPAGSVIVNRPVSFYEEHKTFVWGAAGIIGSLLALIGGLLFLMQRKQKAEHALRESEERYRQVVEIVPDSISMFVEERFAFVNPSALKLLGAEASDQVIGRQIWDFCHPAYRSMGESRFRQCQDGEKTLPLAAFELIRLDGQVRSVESAAVPIMYKGRRAVLSVWRDVTARKQAESALLASEANFRLLVETAPEAIYFQTKGCFAYLNSTALKLLQAESADQLIGRPLTDRVHPDYHDAVRERYRILNAEQRSVPAMEQIYLRLDGSPVAVEVSAAPFRFQGENGALVFARDITSRKKAEAALRESEYRNRTILQAAMDGFWLADMQGRLMEVNAAYCRMSGYSEQELLSMRIPDLEVCETADDTAARIQKIMALGEDRFETRHRRKDGTIIDVDISAQYRPTEGGRCVAFLRDITDRKRADVALRDSEERHRRIVEASSDAFLLRSGGIVIYANPAALKLFRAQHPGDLIGKRYLDLVHPDDRAISAERVKKCMDENCISPPREHRILALDGQVVHVESIGGHVKHRGETQIFGVFRDITERKQADQEKQKLEGQLRQAQKMEAIGTLAGGIAHDFNNILSVIVGNAEILEFSTPVNHPSRGGLDQILAASQRAKQLVHQILAFSRHGKQEKIFMNLGSVVKETLEFLRASLPAFIQLRHYLQPDAGTIMADPTQMQQILMNLCTNASHAMEKDGGVLLIELANTALTEEDARMNPEVEPGNYVKLTVSDTGHGMEPSVLERIFDPYFTTKEPGKGTGLGLAVVHGIVKSHGGMIKVYSEVGKGTAFTIFLPRATGFEKVVDTHLQPLATGTERILCVDDEKALADLSRQMLGELGYQVETRTSPIEALEAFRTNPQKFDLVITDMTMPQMSGLNLARKILEIRPGTPVILCTGFSEQANEQAAGAIGIRAFLYKPLVMQDIADAVRKVLDECSAKNSKTTQAR